MSKFKSKQSKEMQAISTASLPDIVFMLLFFFMVTTTMREDPLLIKNALPSATEIQKLTNKKLVSYIYIGEPLRKDKFGTEPRIQLQDAIKEVKDVVPWIMDEKSKLTEEEMKVFTVSFKVDQGAKMGLVTEVKEELRKADALKINYATLPGHKARK